MNLQGAAVVAGLERKVKALRRQLAQAERAAKAAKKQERKAGLGQRRQ